MSGGPQSLHPVPRLPESPPGASLGGAHLGAEGSLAAGPEGTGAFPGLPSRGSSSPRACVPGFSWVGGAKAAVSTLLSEDH